jgi:hypothetical protein
MLIGSLLFGGTVVNWFAPDLLGSGLMMRALQLSLGSAVMGAYVALLGSVLVCRHAIRWGVVMPLMVLIAGSVLALVSGQSGALSLFLATPLLSGMAVAGGLVTSFLVNGISAARVTR